MALNSSVVSSLQMSQGLKAAYKSTLQGEGKQELSVSLYCTVRHCLSRICWTVTIVMSVTPLLPHRAPLGHEGARLASKLQLSWRKMISSFTSLISSSCQ